MQNFQDTFETPKRSFSTAFPMTVPLNLRGSIAVLTYEHDHVFFKRQLKVN